MRLRPVSAALTASLLLAAGAASAAPAGPEGRWLSGNGNVIVQIAPCGPALCGTIVKVLANRSMDTGAAPMAANTPGVGLKIMTGFRPQGAGHWVGRLYNRQNGKTYDSEISLASPDRMNVRAYVVLPIIGKSQVWRRQP
jgi:uncharacterized protein (DUF2147 family)